MGSVQKKASKAFQAEFTAAMKCNNEVQATQ
jgi:hypothetical protein